MNLLIAALLIAAVIVALALHARPREEASSDKTSAADAQLLPLLRGINYLLTDQPDKALRTLIEVARTHGELAEVYLALGEMFRARGEYARAVRIHQNLLARPDLTSELRLQAAWALAQDYHAGGLLDRALRQYARVLELAPNHLPALKASMRIREDSSEWDEALKLLDRIEAVQDAPEHAHRAALIAQKALQALNDADEDAARAFAEEALQLDAGCAPSYLVKLLIALKHNDEQAACAALERWRRHATPTWAVGVSKASALAAAGMRDAIFRWLQAHAPDEVASLAWVESEYALAGVRAAEEAAKALGMDRPQTLRGWLRLQAYVRSDEIGVLARNWAKKTANWRCARCGVALREIRWRCPQCHAWHTMQPITEEEAECVVVV